MPHPSRTPFAARTEAPAQTQFDFGTPLLNAPVTDDYNVRVAAEEHAAIVRRLQSDQSIFRQDGKPFKTVEAAIRIQRQFDLSDTHRVAQITGGLVLTRLGHSNRPSVLRASAERQAKDPCFLRQEAAFSRARRIGSAADESVLLFENGKIDIIALEWLLSKTAPSSLVA